MTVSVLIDTSFLITLFDEKRPNHRVAGQYFRHMLEHQIPIYFSSIVAAEFGIKQAVTTLPLRKFRMLAFSIPHGKEAARLATLVGPREEGTPRHVARDDVKLIAQASHEKISFILTEDTSTLTKYCERLSADSICRVRPIELVRGFDASVFSVDGQRSFDLEEKDDAWASFS